MRGLGSAFAVLVLLAGCSKEPPGGGTEGESAAGGPKGHKPMDQAELDRGVTICDQYVKRLCRCAETDDALKDRCDLARSQPEALDKLARVLDGSQGKISLRERQEAEAHARKIIAACLRSDGALDPASCPR